MSNKNIKELSGINLVHLKMLHGNGQKQGLDFENCECSICRMRSLKSGEIFEPIQKDENFLINFIKEFPPIFPLSIVPTTSLDEQKGTYLFYSNGNRQQKKESIVKTKTNKIHINYPLAHNIHIFGSNFSKIVPKNEISSFLKKFQDKKENEHRKTSHKKMTASGLLPPLQENNHSQPNPENSLSIRNFNESKFKNSKILYVQAYSQQIPIKFYYDKQKINANFDNILSEYLDEEIQNFDMEKAYSINEQFWQWIFTEYGEEVFVNFITEFYCRAYHFFSKNIIQKAIFYWVFEKPKSQFGDNTKVTEQLGKHKEMLEAQYLIQKSKKLSFKIKLANIKNADVQFYRNIVSFQEQYQEIILNKIKTSQSDTKKESLYQKKSYIYQSRLDNLHSKVRDLFLKQQNKVLNRVEAQKQYEGKQDSNKLARLLLPGMKEEQTIREILNDQFAFQKLILFQEKKVEKERLRRAKQKLLTQTHDNSISRHIYQQSRSRRRNFTSRRIRIRTET